jgi:hypothetical protein
VKRRLTVIKVCGRDYMPTKEEVEKWRKIFADKQIEDASKYNIISNGEVEVEQLEFDDTEQTITFVKIGGDSYRPTSQDLESWRDVFVKEAKDNKDFKIFSHNDVEITQIKVDEIIAIE